MPRKWTELIQAYLELKLGLGYDVRIVEVEKVTEPPSLKMALEFLADDQIGRTMTVVLPLPCRPDGLSGLLSACGIDVVVGHRFAPRGLVGRSVRVFFKERPGGDVAVARFEACPTSAGN